MAHGVQIRVSPENKGRGLFAITTFKEGEMLFEEQPLVCAQFLWNAFYNYAACNHCLRPLETAEEACRRLTESPNLELPHPECCETVKEKHTRCQHCQIRYCSTECEQAALSQYHRVLCLGQSSSDPSHPLLRLQEAWKQVHYPPETCSIMLLAKIMATVKQSTDKSSFLQTLSQFCKATVNQEQDIAHKLLGAQFQTQLETFRSLLTEALYDESIQEWFTPEGFQSLFALIGTNGQGIGTSSISRWVAHCEELQLPEDEKVPLDAYIDELYENLNKVSGTFLDCEGSGLYVIQSACNHSCEPNAEVTFPHNNSTLVVKALRDIAAEEEILISYLDECDLGRSRHSRQKILRENYLFICDCPKCRREADQPDVTSDEESMEED